MHKINQKTNSILLKTIPRKIDLKVPVQDTEKKSFSGIDIWNCYEFSYLLISGKPYIGILRIEYSSDSELFIESKSLKLYLNSFNMKRYTNNNHILHLIKNDLQNKLKTKSVYLNLLNYEDFAQTFSLKDIFFSIDKIDTASEFLYNLKSDILNTQFNPNQEFFLMSNLLKSNCPLTGQPDWGTIYIYYHSNKKKVLEESLLRYIVSFRNQEGFHEDCCERIMNDLLAEANPKKLQIICKYNRRGGIDINPLRIYPPARSIYDVLVPSMKKIIYTREFRQ